MKRQSAVKQPFKVIQILYVTVGHELGIEPGSCLLIFNLIVVINVSC
ncbi:hypothetical protein FHS17_001565 [Paenibacillus lupini]|nr:hypothetical protein [Paenibacillus lupini]